MLLAAWNRTQNSQEGQGRMFHGNFWSNIEMDLATGKLEEKPNLLPTRQSLYTMTDPDWMVEHLQDDLALQMALYSRGEISDIDTASLRTLSQHLDHPLTPTEGHATRDAVAALLDAYSFAATKAILNKARAFTNQHQKKLLVILLDPYRVLRPMLQERSRYDQEIVDFLRENKFHVFDMNLVHRRDYRAYKLSPKDYMTRYFIGHYSPAGNHFFAYAIKDTVVEWLDPKPLPYRDTTQRIIDFKGYLQEY